MIELPPAPRPAVSVVMVTYGAWTWVERSLQGLVTNTEPCYEVVVVDNASPDETTENLRTSVRGATLVLNDRNVGFGPGSNQGALRARGRYLCFLNSDAVVQPGWLPPLLTTLESGRVGAVVPRFLNLDGTLQEAGSVVGSDGHTRSFGDGLDPNRPEFGFPRVVDFGSAACLVTRRSDFLAFGGFDAVYGVGYYEDVDYCFRLRESGLDTVYVPSSTVVHARAASSSLELASIRIAANREVFLSRWRDRLSGRPRLEKTSNLDARVIASRDAEAADRLLVLADGLDDGLLRFLHEVSAFWPHVRLTLLLRGAAQDPRVSALAAQGVETVVQDGDPESWFEERLFQASAVLAWQPEILLELDSVIRRTQPQALRALHLDGRPRAPLARSRATDAVASSDLVLCDTQGAARLAEAPGRGRPAFVLIPETYRRTLGEALACLGVALSLSVMATR